MTACAASRSQDWVGEDGPAQWSRESGRRGQNSMRSMNAPELQAIHKRFVRREARESASGVGSHFRWGLDRGRAGAGACGRSQPAAGWRGPRHRLRSLGAE